MNFRISLDIFDRKAFEESPITFYVTCTNVETGKAEYIRMDNMDEIDYMRASASMPLVSQIVEVGGMKLLDGWCGRQRSSRCVPKTWL